MGHLRDEDYGYSATVRDLGSLDKVLAHLARLPWEERPASHIDLGCGLGGPALYVSGHLGISRTVGVDHSERVLRRAQERGLTVLPADLNSERVPFDDGSFDLVTSFGVLEHLALYDNLLGEARRLLRDGGWLVLTTPNLGSYVNRLALLFGYQPQEVEISARVSAGVLPLYRWNGNGARPLGYERPRDAHIHAPTLRCLRDLLTYYGMRVVLVRGLSPKTGGWPAHVLDLVFGRTPSLSRRVIVLARKLPAGHWSP